MQRYKLTVSYMGTNFCGWQPSKISKPSVQGSIEQAVQTLMPGVPVVIYGSGRTDSGVHASGQVCHVDIARQRKYSPNVLQQQQLRSDTLTSSTLRRVFPSGETTYSAWTVFCKEQLRILSKIRKTEHKLREKHQLCVAQGDASGQRGQGGEEIKFTSQLPSCVDYIQDTPLRSLMNVRRLPMSVPNCIFAAAVAIECVKPQAQHKYKYNYANICVNGVEGISGLHMDLGIIPKPNPTTELESIQVAEREAELLNELKSFPLLHLQGNINIPLLQPPLPPYALTKALNNSLQQNPVSSAISILSAIPVPSKFHARFDAYKRRYVYRILIGDTVDMHEHNKVWNLNIINPSQFDVSKAEYVANALVGHQNYDSFRSTQCQAKSPVRKVDSIQLYWTKSHTEQLQGHPFVYPDDGQDLHESMYDDLEGLGLGFDQSYDDSIEIVRKYYEAMTPSQSAIVDHHLLNKANTNTAKTRPPVREGSVLNISVTARSFLHSQVRIMVGAIVSAGLGRFPHQDIHRVLKEENRTKNPCPTAPAQGLYLTHVSYPTAEQRAKWKQVQFLQLDVMKSLDQTKENNKNN